MTSVLGRRSAAFVLTLLLCSSELAADDLQQWTSLLLTNRFDERWSATFLTQGRIDDDTTGGQILLLRPELGYNVSREVQFSLGFDYFTKFNEGRSNEYRVWEQLGVEQNLGGVGITNRVRVEQRFIDGADGVGLRARYRLRGQGWLGAERDWLLFASNEVFFNINDVERGPRAGFNQNRLQTGLGYKLRKGARIEAAHQWTAYANRNAQVLLLTLRLDFSQLAGED